jgi:hypothetical protein
MLLGRRHVRNRLTKGIVHVVPIELAPLESGLLFLVEEVKITWGTEEVAEPVKFAVQGGKMFEITGR